MKFKLFVIPLTLLSFFASCKNEKNKTNNYESIVLNFDGEKMLIENHKDSINVEHITVYDSTGKVYKKFKLIDDLKNGIENGFYESGYLRYQTYYKNDTLEGKSTWYFDNEKSPIKTIYTYEKGKIAGNHKQFYINGNLERYFSTTFKEEITFDIQYDENQKEKRIPINNKYKTMGVINSSDFNFNIYDTIRYTAYLSTPENVKIKYFYSLSPLKSNYNQLKNMEIANSKVDFDTLLNKKGSYILKEKILINRIDIDSTFFEEYTHKINVN